MSLAELFNLLNGIDGFTGKVAYYQFPKDEAPELPFIAYLCTDSNNFVADGLVYQKFLNVQVELYTEQKDLISEKKIEDALDGAEIVWEKSEVYLDDERCFMNVYNFQI